MGHDYSIVGLVSRQSAASGHCWRIGRAVAGHESQSVGRRVRSLPGGGRSRLALLRWRHAGGLDHFGRPPVVGGDGCGGARPTGFPVHPSESPRVSARLTGNRCRGWGGEVEPGRRGQSWPIQAPSGARPGTRAGGGVGAGLWQARSADLAAGDLRAQDRRGLCPQCRRRQPGARPSQRQAWQDRQGPGGRAAQVRGGSPRPDAATGSTAVHLADRRPTRSQGVAAAGVRASQGSDRPTRHHAALFAAHGRVSGHPGRCRRQGCPSHAGPRQRRHDPRHLRPPLGPRARRCRAPLRPADGGPGPIRRGSSADASRG